jgi:putative endonuclease
LAKHKGFTSKATDWQIVYTEAFPSQELAMQREKQLKNWKSKIRIEELIKRSSTE